MMMTDKDKYLAFAKAVNGLSDERIITADTYRAMWRAFKEEQRAKAVKKAKYKIGDRITEGHGRSIEVTEIGIASGSDPWDWQIVYHGRKLNPDGAYSKSQKSMGLRERRCKAFVPRNWAKYD